MSTSEWRDESSFYNVSVILREDTPQSNTGSENFNNSAMDVSLLDQYLDRIGILQSVTSNTCEFKISLVTEVCVCFILQKAWSTIPAIISLNGEKLFWSPNLVSCLVFHNGMLRHTMSLGTYMPIESPFVIHTPVKGNSRFHSSIF